MELMEFEQPTGMYWATAILFLGPCALLVYAWKRSLGTGGSSGLPVWRRIVVRGALLAGVLSTVLHIVWNVSWLYNGGSPHGMGAGPGIWEPLGPIMVWTFAAATLVGVAFARGLSRLWFVGWSVSMYAVFQMIYMLQFD